MNFFLKNVPCRSDIQDSPSLYGTTSQSKSMLFTAKFKSMLFILFIASSFLTLYFWLSLNFQSRSGEKPVAQLSVQFRHCAWACSLSRATSYCFDVTSSPPTLSLFPIEGGIAHRHRGFLHVRKSTGVVCGLRGVDSHALGVEVRTFLQSLGNGWK